MTSRKLKIDFFRTSKYKKEKGQKERRKMRWRIVNYGGRYAIQHKEGILCLWKYVVKFRKDSFEWPEPVTFKTYAEAANELARLAEKYR